MHLCQKNGSSHCVRVLPWCWARDSHARIIEGLCFFDTPIRFGRFGCATNVLPTYCQKRIVTYRIHSVRCERKKAKYSIWLLIQNESIQVFHRSGCAEKLRLCLPIHNRISKLTERFRTNWKGFFDGFKSHWENNLLATSGALIAIPTY